MKKTFTRLLTLSGILVISSPCLADQKDAIADIEGTLSVMVLGSGGPVATSAGRASAGYMIFTDGDPNPRIIMDVGGGTYQRIAQSGINIADLDVILLSHLHADHTGDLTSVIKTLYFHNNQKNQIRNKSVRIFGPDSTAYKGTPGTEFPDGSIQYPSTTDYADGHYSVAKGGVERYLNAFVPAITQMQGMFSYEAKDLNSAWKATDNPQIETVYEDGKGLKVTSIAVNHGPVPAVAFRIDYKGHSIVYSGDTSSVSNNMITLSQGADLLIYDTAITRTLPTNPVFHVLHTEPERIGQVAAAANVRQVVLSHITPVTEPRLEEVKQAIVDNGFSGKIRVAKDLKVYNLGSDD